MLHSFEHLLLDVTHGVRHAGVEVGGQVEEGLEGGFAGFAIIEGGLQLLDELLGGCHVLLAALPDFSVELLTGGFGRLNSGNELDSSIIDGTTFKGNR
ncbi:CRISPR-associated DxTHG motif protein [Pseudomonas sp. MWU12-2323]|nr:CRISPR-associated DxTHG motif protein [Pseudomonas sp. MWU12-2323]